MYKDLFTLCGFGAEEIKREGDRIEKTLQVAGINAEDMERAKNRVNQYFDLELIGVRKLLRLHLRTFMSMVLARDENRKVVYKDWILHAQLGHALIRAAPDVFVAAPEEVIGVVMGQIFDKIIPLLEAGEQYGLHAGGDHCGSVQILVGAIKTGLLPMPDLMITGGYFCDQMAEGAHILHHMDGVPIAYIDGVIDTPWEIVPDFNKRIIDYTAGTFVRAIKKFEEITGAAVTDDMKQSGRVDSGKALRALNELEQLIVKSDPAPISRIDLGLTTWIGVSVPLREKEREERYEALCLLTEEVRQRIAEGRPGKGVAEEGAPVIYTQVTSNVDPAMAKLVEGAGLRIGGIDPARAPSERINLESTDFEHKIAEGYLRARWMNSSLDHSELVRRICEHTNCVGAIIGSPYCCRAITVDFLMMKQYLEEKLGIPVLVVETDYFDPRKYGIESLRTRIESFAEMLKMRATDVGKDAMKVGKKGTPGRIHG